ncbi:hypothetical protein FP744_10000483 [Trichoderma asperellum]
MSSQAPLMPTFRGHISTTMDALILFECCLHGRLNHVPRRPHDRERQDLIASGNIFIYEEHASGIKRWTDGVSWSPSRILGNFLIYRELDKPFPPGEKKRALKKKKNSQGISKPDARTNAGFSTVGMDPAHIKDPERSLVGSLVDSYPFKKNGLIKKTISITFQGVPHHLVSYYNVDDVLKGNLVTPSNYPLFADVQPRAELLMSQNFRNPLDEAAIFSQEERGLLPISAANFYTMAAPVQDLSPHGVVMTQPMAVQGMASHQPMTPYPTGLEYDFFQVQQQQQQAAHHHQALPHHAHHQSQAQHHHYQYQQHHHQLQQPHHQHEDHQAHYHELQQPLQHHQPSPQDQAKPEQQQQPPSGAFMPPGSWNYDPNDSYYF